MSTVLTNGFGSFSGTSMASPNAAGVCALIAIRNPNLTPLQIKNVLSHHNSTDWLEPVFTATGARVNAYKCLTNEVILTGGNNHQPIITELPISVTVKCGDAFDYSFTASDSDGDPLAYYVYSSFGDVVRSNRATFKTPLCIRNQSHWIRAVVLDRNGGVAEGKTWVDVIGDSNLPVRFELRTDFGKFSAPFYNWASICHTNNSDPLVPWTATVFAYRPRKLTSWGSAPMTLNCWGASMPVAETDEIMFEVQARNSLGAEYTSQREYMNGSGKVANPTNQHPFAILSHSVLDGTAPFSVSWDTSRSYDVDGQIVGRWYMRPDGILTTAGLRGTNVYATPGRYPFMFWLEDDRGGGISIWREINVLYGATNAPPPPPPPPPAPVLVAPRDLSATGTSSITLNWSDTSTGEDRWLVEYRIKGKGKPTNWAVLATKPANSTSHGFVPSRGGNWSFRVRACAVMVCSSESNTVTVSVR